MVATCLPYVLVALGVPTHRAVKKSYRQHGVTLRRLHSLFVDIGEFLSVADKTEFSQADIAELPNRRKKASRDDTPLAFDIVHLELSEVVLRKERRCKELSSAPFHRRTGRS